MRKYRGFTLVEMLIVMTLLGILSAIGISSFGGLRASITLNETSKDLQQVLRDTQRDSMLLKRNADERWIYGIGVDLSTTPDDGAYRIFKWCSPFLDYGESYQTLSSIYMTSKFPNYNPDEDLGDIYNDNGNGSLPVYVEWADNCEGAPSVVDSRGVMAPLQSNLPGIVEPPIRIGFESADNSQRISYVVFESITGRALFYNQNGNLMNFNTDGSLNDEFEDFVVYLSTEDETRVVAVEVLSVSGKVSVSSPAVEDLPDTVSFALPVYNPDTSNSPTLPDSTVNDRVDIKDKLPVYIPPEEQPTYPTGPTRPSDWTDWGRLPVSPY